MYFKGKTLRGFGNIFLPPMPTKPIKLRKIDKQRAPRVALLSESVIS